MALKDKNVSWPCFFHGYQEEHRMEQGQPVSMCKTTGQRKGTLTLFVTEQSSVNFYQMCSLMIQLLNKYPIDLKCKYKFKQTSLFLVFDCGAHLAQKDL